ncbi:translation initiation factor eIF-2B [Halobacillus amylolyticus]|uniref:Translation initiation factor eIF-2B n=1 Tax=Halobacillus amylolyticus TaxID=2932259 RepID=A0ABY4HAK5_9BACI|nr:translation initiation factor eIF-2B [Halobacillus amylolyticus]UOR11328.1 translation initiation factor eIF-2B [Halobacillus amylolyticus]
MISENDARQVLTDEQSIKAFDDIVYQRILGASKHINMISDMIESIALEGRRNNLSVNSVIEKILTISQYFIETRGSASQAISNAINIMIRNIDEARDLDIEEAAKFIIQKKNDYLNQYQEAVNKVVEYGIKTASSMKTIMVFDYSSTVNKLLQNLKNENGDYTIIIPESRVIDGGYPFVSTCHEAGHKIKFIPDSAIMYFLKDCDGAFFGAETFHPDGTAFNTTGSDMVGLVCKEFNIPLYVLTPMMKLDMRAIYGYEKKLKINNLEDTLTSNWNLVEKSNIDFLCPELIGVESKYITAIITEKGIIPANQLIETSNRFHSSLKGE